MCTIYELLARRQAVRSDALLALGEVPLTYQALFKEVTEIGQQLARYGLGPGDRVALALPTSACSAVALLGVACHATAAPLNPSYRRREFEFYFSDLGARAVIVPVSSGDEARAAAKACNVPVIELSERPRTAGRLSLMSDMAATSMAETRPPDGGDVALVLHTSGTTGRPKRVPLTHEKLCATAANIRDALQLSESDRCLQCMPLFHVHGILNALLSSLLAGGTILSMPGYTPSLFWTWYARLKPTWYTAVPTIHQSIIATADSSGISVAEYQVRFVRSSSAPLSPATLARLQELFRAPVIESYGMTEVDQITTNRLPPGRRKPGSVGLPGGPEVTILDPSGNTLAPYETGEVCVTGTNVFNGYEDAAVANNDAFIGGWFRTGDLGYLDADGFLFLIGRAKDIINRGGEKISPREIEDVLLEHPSVAEAAAFGVPDDFLGQEISAAVVLRPAATATSTELRSFVASQIASFKIPRTVHFLTELPKGATGKIRRIELTERFQAEQRVPTETFDDLSELQSALVSLIRNIRPGICFPSTSENFVVVGLESMDISAAALEISDALHVPYTANLLYEYPTLAALSTHLSQVYRTNCEQLLHRRESWISSI